MTIGGPLDLRALALLHRPRDQPSLRREAEKLRRLGRSFADIAQTIGLTEPAVRELLDASR